STMNGSKFSPGFSATYALDINGGGANPTWFSNKYDLTQANPSSQFIGQFDGTVGGSANVGGTIQSVNNSNTAGVIGGQVSAHQYQLERRSGSRLRRRQRKLRFGRRHRHARWQPHRRADHL